MKKHPDKSASPKSKTRPVEAGPKAPKKAKAQRPWSKAAKLKMRQEKSALSFRADMIRREKILQHIYPRLLKFALRAESDNSETENAEKVTSSILPPDTLL